MRTTVELPDELRGDLMRIAAIRGQKGFSGVLEEAVRYYLLHRAELPDEELRRTVDGLDGSISEEEGERLQRLVRELREGWK